MLRIRRFEEKLSDLLEAGEIKCPCHLYIGQEAIAVGVCTALAKKDYVWGTHRSHGHYLAKGGDMNAMFAEILGKTDGCAKGRGGSMHLFSKDVGILGTVPIVAATISVAVGAGWAAKMCGSGALSVAFFGDGATEEGQFHESVNIAALNRLPVIFVCENNLYSSHMHILERRPLDNIDQIGQLYGIPGVQLDGNDAEAVYLATQEAVRRAREGEGPTLMECRTYRWRGHVGPSWDMDVGVKRKGELKEWMKFCPIDRTAKALLERGLTQEDLDQIERAVQSEVAASEKFARYSFMPEEDELLDHVFFPRVGDS